MLNSFLRLRKFLGGQGGEFFCAGLARGQHRRALRGEQKDRTVSY
jgi:hypothetical protein